MKKVTVAAITLLGVVGFNAPIHARPQEAYQQSVHQKITKKIRVVAAFAKAQYKGSPQFAPIGGTVISYATNTPQEVISLNDVFYLKVQDVWVLSANAQGPWTPAQFIPEVIPAVVCGQQNANPYEPSQICTLPWGSGLTYAVWKTP